MARPFVAPMKRQTRDLERVREGLRGWLAARLPGASGLALSPLSAPTGSGVANETLLFEARFREAGQTRTRGFAARLATHSKLYMSGGVELPYRMYAALADAPGVSVPRLLGYEPDATVIGTAFFVMERVDGQVPPDRPHYTEGGFVFEATPAQRRELWEDAVRAMARLHRVEAARFPFLERPRLGASGFEQELAHWRIYYDWARAGREHETMERGWAWLAANQPAVKPTALSWGDSRVGNMIFRDFRVHAILDWDQVSLMGPGADLAWWIQMDRFAWELLPGIGTPDDLVDLWEAESGMRAEGLHWYRVFTAFRLGAIQLKLHEQMLSEGYEGKETAELAIKTGSIEQLALLLGLPLPGPATTKLPELRRS